MRNLIRALALLSGLVAGCASAACLDQSRIDELTQRFRDRVPAPNPPAMDDIDAACTRAKLNVWLAARYGAPVGYKVELTNPAVQKRFWQDRPVWGRLYAGMLRENGAEVDALFGARALFEADLLVRVKSEDINRAESPMDVLQAVDRIIPFIELPDLLVESPSRLSGRGLEAINAGARMGVMGRPIAVPTLRAERYAMLDALKNMRVSLLDGKGKLIGEGRGGDVLGQPLFAVPWLAGALARENRALKAGDLVSLGSFTPLFAPRPGLKVTAIYAGLPGAEPVSVTFR